MARPRKSPPPPAKGLVESHGRWYLQSTADGKPKWLPLTRVSEGNAAVLAALSKLLGREIQKSGNLPERIAEFKKVWLKKLTPGVQDEYTRMLDNLAIALKDFNTEEVTPADVYDVLVQFEDTPTQARAYKARLSTFFRWCCAPKRYATTNPCREVWLEAPPKRDVRMDAGAFWKIHAAMATGKDGRSTSTGPMAQCLLEAFYLVEQRTTDLRILKQSQIRDGWIHFKPTKTSRTSGAKVKWKVTSAVQSVLDRAAAVRKSYDVVSTVYVFPTPEGGPYSARRFLGIWNRALGRCGLEDSGFVPKDILPSSMTDAEEQGYDMTQLQKGRGHTTVTTTEGYMRQRRVAESEIELALPPKEKK